MNIWQKLWAYLKGTANDAVDASIDPGTMMRQGVREMADAIREYEKALTEARTQRNLVQNQYNAAKKDADEWDQVAEVAVSKGQDDNARQALERSDVAHQTLDRLSAALEGMNAQIAKLEGSLAELKSRKDQVATEATLLEARTKAADASIAINATIQGVGDNNFGEMMDIARKKTDEKEARADALTSTSASAGDDLKAKIMGSDTAGADSRVEDRLAKMMLEAERKKREAEQEAEDKRKRDEEQRRRRNRDDDNSSITATNTAAFVAATDSSPSYGSSSHGSSRSHDSCSSSSSSSDSGSCGGGGGD
jgi:phage shock protein A